MLPNAFSEHLMVLQAWQEVAEKGLVTDEECRTFAASHWFRSREEWLAPLNAELKQTFDLLHFEEGTTTDAHWTEYLRSKDDRMNDSLKSGLQNGKSSKDSGSKPAHSHGCNDQNAEGKRVRLLAEGYSKFFFGVASGQLKGHLKQRSSQEVDRITEGMQARFIALASVRPVELKLASALIVLRRK